MGTETDQLRATYNRARALSGMRLKTWWDHFLEVHDYYKEHNSYDSISVTVPFWSHFSTSVRKAYKAGHLSREQITALKEIDFPFQPMKSASRSKGSKLTTTIQLHEISQTVIPLTNEEQIELDTNIKHYQIRYNNGELAEKTVSRLNLRAHDI